MSVWEQLATDQTDPWQVVPRQIFTPYDCVQVVPRQVFTPYSGLLISTVFCYCQSHWLSLGNQCVSVKSALDISNTDISKHL